MQKKTGVGGKAGSITASALIILNDPELVAGLAVPFVVNLADEKPGKPKGAGLPTGGVEEWDDSPKHGAFRELKAEIGLDGIFVSAYEFRESAQRKYIVHDQDGNEVRPPLPFFKDKEVAPPHLRRGETLDTNDVLVFRVSVPNWRETPLRKFLLAEKKYLLEGCGLTAEEVNRDGFLIHFDDCDPADVAALGIEEMNEICGIGIIPISKIPDLIRESPRDENGNFVFYLGHLLRVQRVINEICREFLVATPELVPERKSSKRR